MMINKLVGQRIGLSVGNIFTIEKPFMLTVGSIKLFIKEDILEHFYKFRYLVAYSVIFWH